MEMPVKCPLPETYVTETADEVSATSRIDNTQILMVINFALMTVETLVSQAGLSPRQLFTNLVREKISQISDAFVTERPY